MELNDIQRMDKEFHEGLQDYLNKKEFVIDGPEAYIWACKTYEQNINTSRKRGRYLFNKLFDFGKKVIDGNINFTMPKRNELP